MDMSDLQIPPPVNEVKFEALCLALFRAEWADPLAQRNGRRGQEQAGVDIFGINHAQDGKQWGVQCKCKDARLGKTLSASEVDGELALADGFTPPLAHFIIATTAANDAKIQQHVRALNAARQGKFPVTVFSWEVLQDLLVKHPAVASQFYGNGWLPKVAAFHLPEMRLSPHFSDPLNHLAELRRQLTTQKSAAVLAATTVQGMGGVGKTQLALKYCHEFRAEYAGVWWFSAENVGVLETECMAFCGSHQIELVPNIPAQQAMADWLAALPATALPWLLVYDNADDAKALKKFLPRAGAHHVLITSRLPTWAGMGALHLDVWTGAQALAFLQARLPHESESALLALTLALDGLPLALEQACAYLGNNHISVTDYIDRVMQLGNDIALLGREDSDDCAKSVLVTLSLAFDRLSAPAQALLQLCGYLAPEPVPEYVFTEELDNLPESLQAAGQDQFLWRDTVAELERYALCQAPLLMQADFLGNNGVQQRCLVLHRLTQTAARAWLGAGTGAGSGAGTDVATDTSAVRPGFDAFRHVIMLLSGVFPAKPSQPEHWPRCRSLMPHVQRLAAFYAKANVEPQYYASLLAQLAVYLTYGPALLPETLRLERLALAIRQTALGEDHPDTLESMNNLAFTLWQQGDLPGARLLEEKTLDIQRSVLGEDHPDTLTSMSNLATTLSHQSDLPGARLLQEKTLAIRRRVQGEEHPETLISMNNLAETLRQQGDLPGAQRLQEKTLDICRRVQGEDHPATLTAMNNLAATLGQQGDLPGARLLHEKALASRRRVLGEDHPDTLRSKKNLAGTLDDMGEPAAAQALRDEVANSAARQ
jgi:tetratricopeptide (TPR) repeat protein